MGDNDLYDSSDGLTPSQRKHDELFGDVLDDSQGDPLFVPKDSDLETEEEEFDYHDSDKDFYQLSGKIGPRGLASKNLQKNTADEDYFEWGSGKKAGKKAKTKGGKGDSKKKSDKGRNKKVPGPDPSKDPTIPPILQKYSLVNNKKRLGMSSGLGFTVRRDSANDSLSASGSTSNTPAPASKGVKASQKPSTSSKKGKKQKPDEELNSQLSINSNEEINATTPGSLPDISETLTRRDISPTRCDTPSLCPTPPPNLSPIPSLNLASGTQTDDTQNKSKAQTCRTWEADKYLAVLEAVYEVMTRTSVPVRDIYWPNVRNHITMLYGQMFTELEDFSTGSNKNRSLKRKFVLAYEAFVNDNVTELKRLLSFPMADLMSKVNIMLHKILALDSFLTDQKQNTSSDKSATKKTKTAETAGKSKNLFEVVTDGTEGKRAKKAKRDDERNHRMTGAAAELEKEKLKWEDQLNKEIERERKRSEEEQAERNFNKQMSLMTSSVMMSVVNNLQSQTKNPAQPSTSREHVPEEEKLRIQELNENPNILTDSPPVILLVDRSNTAAAVIEKMRRHFGIFDEIQGMIMERGTERQCIESIQQIKAQSVAFKVYQRKSSGLFYFLLSNIY